MNRLLAAITILVLPTVSACAGMGEPARRTVATATLLDADGAVMGNAVLATVGDRVDFMANASGLRAGSVHGMHLHAVGRCEPRDFKSAGGHLNPAGRQHGTMNPQGSHLGDLPNLSVGADGAGAASVLLEGAADDVLGQVFDADGTAIVLHADPDDYRADPSGNSGARILCGVFARTR